eukprot:CAMPEP_0195514916 /NCGR_PEP_ID=MMETSP0794_2-20130614/6163_1 /TAXON_ID=515487 /ORGANISM="Stephanopyxis turris, Strain CCMP 815" /LENGTH=104 /DNA_ID=CAMNT_0040643265 /DNA_START=424 /DNA_END=737 /DNA_ORIENTATION=+
MAFMSPVLEAALALGRFSGRSDSLVSPRSPPVSYALAFAFDAVDVSAIEAALVTAALTVQRIRVIAVRIVLVSIDLDLLYFRVSATSATWRHVAGGTNEPKVIV